MATLVEPAAPRIIAMSRSDATVYIVDDDASVREALAWLLRSRRLLSESFDSAEACEQALGQAEPAAPACLLLDVRMPGASGLALFDRLVERGVAHAWPVIFLTGHASVATAVEALKRGAFDFCEKPFSDNALVDRVERALGVSAERVAQLVVQRALRARMGELTERERDVMRLVADGRPNKLIADELGISVRTVEVHRARVFEKMDVKSAVELSRALQQVPS